MFSFEGILTCDEDPHHILRTSTSFLSTSEWDLARATVEKLMWVRENILQGGAGLAGPQIGMSQPIFIFTSDRTTESLKAVINPSFEPVGTALIEGEEACFSIPLRCTTVKRWETIKVKYQNLEGHIIEGILDGFAAKVFQHEMDHLQGRLTIDHETAQVLTFPDEEAFIKHMQNIHCEDSKRYNSQTHS